MKKKCTCRVCKMIARINSKEGFWDQETKTLVDDLFTAWASESDDATFYKGELESLKKQLDELRQDKSISLLD